MLNIKQISQCQSIQLQQKKMLSRSHSFGILVHWRKKVSRKIFHFLIIYKYKVFDKVCHAIMQSCKAKMQNTQTIHITCSHHQTTTHILLQKNSYNQSKRTLIIYTSETEITEFNKTKILNDKTIKMGNFLLAYFPWFWFFFIILILLVSHFS